MGIKCDYCDELSVNYVIVTPAAHGTCKGESILTHGPTFAYGCKVHLPQIKAAVREGKRKRFVRRAKDIIPGQVSLYDYL